MPYEPKHLKRWTRPDSYFGADWPEYFAACGRSRDSSTLEESNFQSILKALGGESDTVIIVRESHWAVGWVEWLAIHESDSASLETADDIRARLEGYPVVDEDHWSALEQETADKVWRDCYRPKERIEYIRRNSEQFEFHNFADLLGCVRGNYFAGYASELLG